MSIDGILSGAKTAEQKMRALAKIQKVIKRQWLTARIFGLVYFVNTFFLLTSCFTLFCDEEDKALWKKFPSIIAKMLDACNKWILSIPEWTVFNKINEWILSVSKGNLEALPIWVIYLVALIMAAIAVPSIIILIVKAIITVFISGDGSSSPKGTLPECCKKTYELVPGFRFDEYRLARKGNVICCIILALLVIWALIYEEFFLGSNPDIGRIFREIIGKVIFFGLLRVVLQWLSIIPSMAAAYGNMFGPGSSDLEKLEKFWAGVDPEKNAELVRRAAEREWREREEERERLRRSSISSSSDSGTIWGMSHEEWNRMNDDLDAVQSYIAQEHGSDYFKDV